MFFTRLGSLNALEQSRSSRFWSSWLGGPMPSADSIGRICAQTDADTVRGAIRTVYSRLKRVKALHVLGHGLVPLILDGHESHATYRRHCDGCLKRKISTKNGERIQYYHRHVTAYLAFEDFSLLLDAEPMRPGEDEIQTAIRLLDRLHRMYARAFDVVLGDALYTDPRVYQWAGHHNKDMLTVLKDERRDLLTDVKGLLPAVEPTEHTKGKTERQCWDVHDLTSWPQAGRPVRVVRSLERTPVQRQLTGEIEEEISDWYWVTTLSGQKANVRAVVELGHLRWDIENRGFNETTTRWHADHVYKHDAVAMLVFWLLCMLAFNVFQAFFWRNLKPARRAKFSMLHIARVLASAIYAELPEQHSVPP